MKKRIYIFVFTLCAVVTGYCFGETVNTVKDCFDRMSNDISQVVTIKGRFVEFELEAVCKQGPCPSVTHFALEDLSDPKYKILIYQTDPLAQRLEKGKVYVLKGVLEKGVSNFKPQEIIKGPSNDEK